MDFSHLKRLEVADRTAKYTIYQIEDEPVLIMKSATEANKPFFNAVLLETRAARNPQQIKTDAKTVKKNRNHDRKLFPKHVIVGWEGIKDASGKEVPFSKENCEAFLTSLPDWIFDGIRAFATDSANFTGVNQDQIEDGAKK